MILRVLFYLFILWIDGCFNSSDRELRFLRLWLEKLFSRDSIGENRIFRSLRCCLSSYACYLPLDYHPPHFFVSPLLRRIRAFFRPLLGGSFLSATLFFFFFFFIRVSRISRCKCNGRCDEQTNYFHRDDRFDVRNSGVAESLANESLQGCSLTSTTASFEWEWYSRCILPSLLSIDTFPRLDSILDKINIDQVHIMIRLV